MKVIFLSIYALIFALFLAAIFYYGWKERERSEQEKDIALEENKEQGITELEKTEEQKKELQEKQENIGENLDAVEDKKEFIDQKSEATVSDESKIGKDTIYCLEIYDTFTQELNVEEGEIPPGFLGMTREELNHYCELTAFSAGQVTVRKTYDGSGLKYRYYMVLEQGCVTVYYSDKKTVYEHTDILEENLPEEEAEKLKKGIYIEDEESLYSMLESYTS